MTTISNENPAITHREPTSAVRVTTFSRQSFNDPRKGNLSGNFTASVNGVLVTAMADVEYDAKEVPPPPKSKLEAALDFTPPQSAYEKLMAALVYKALSGSGVYDYNRFPGTVPNELIPTGALHYDHA